MSRGDWSALRAKLELLIQCQARLERLDMGNSDDVDHARDVLSQMGEIFEEARMEIDEGHETLNAIELESDEEEEDEDE